MAARLLNTYAGLGVVLVLAALSLTAPLVRAAPSEETAATVRMVEYTYSPKTVTVAAGATVTWQNAGTEAHTATLAGAFDTGSVAPGAASSVTLTEPGTFQYACQFHGGPTGAGMSGTVVVTAASVAASNGGMPPVGANALRLFPLVLAACGLILLGFGLRTVRLER